MASNPRGRGGQENAEDDDDDFGDFGGFEAAEPAADVAASQAQAGASPWAVFNAGNAPGRPDLLCAQNRFPTYLDPSDIAGSSNESGNLNLNNSVPNGPIQPQADLIAENQDLFDQARIAENVLDGTLNAATAASFHANLNAVNGRLPDIGLGINENRLFAQGENMNQPTLNPSDPVPPLELPQDGAPAAERLNMVQQDLVGRGEEENNAEPPPVVVENAAAEVAHAAEGEASRPTDSALQEQLNILLERNRTLEEELTRSREELAVQRSRLQEVQTRHEEELQEVRGAGHDAVKVVVDQYKEQSRVVVVEQQEIAQRHLVETVSEQMKAFQEMLQMQQELHERQREEDRQELGRRIDRAVEEARQQQQEQFDAFLAKEQVTQKEAIEKAVEEERAASQEKIQKSIEAEQEQARARLEEVKVEHSQALEEERRSHEAALTSLREEQQRLAQEQMSQLMNEERERGREAIREALEASRQNTRAYIDEQRQADSRVRRRHLASLDVFLESSRQQIALLLESERPESSSASASASASTPSSASAPSLSASSSSKDGNKNESSGDS